MELSKKNKLVLETFQEGYDISKEGWLIRKDGSIKKEFRVGKNGYLFVSLRLPLDKRGQVSIHKLQAYKKFGELMFKPNMVVRHLNGDSLDNSFDNIDIGTCSDNMMDILPEVRSIKAINATRKKQDSIRSFEERCLIYEDLKNKIPYSEIMKKYSISSKGTLSFMKNKSLEYIEYLSK